jgi:hypothetical protein
MSEEFDASLVYTHPVSEEAMAEQDRSVAQLMLRPNALANAKLHAENELRRLIAACNRLAWRSVPADLRPPTPEEAAALLERLTEEEREKLMTDARATAEQRILVVKMQEAHEQALVQMQAEEQELVQRQEEAQELAEFEAFDAAGKEARFQAWRASRAG